ncbi:hypothetical protein G6O69_13110 [Pseudenhygromyxa sp. WMMC2535]|uniref:hypothetical protein n=1 Tax=Pseudenhygromyxa sp. WMMC2535 TaxID=2712867 RepID=UPI001554CF91|nr:hypothetical protein [Pseudenhygromyxa sp. WMMC2535]NVB38773.1 hypothetical protein [Pseudenhygromyxa sp. WMMC2535]
MLASSHWPLHLAAALYALNLGVGVSAQLMRARFGALHHWLYALVFVAAIAATVLCFHWALLATLAALALLPLTKPPALAHPAVATLGACGYLAAYASAYLL